MTSQARTIAFFGATGGCAANTLAKSLQAGYKCSALARTPSKLLNLLETTHNISKSLLDANLTVVQGNIKSVEDVERALVLHDKLVDIIIFGVGGSPKLALSLVRPITLDDPHVCEEGMKAIVEALRDLKQSGQENAPTVVAISTTGVTDGKRDVPLAMYGLYHYLLSVPHADKRRMELTLIEASATKDSPVGGFVVVRPTLLSDGSARGKDAVRVGWEIPKLVDASGKETELGPALGYRVSRADVGNWIFEEVVQDAPGWNGKCVTLTY